MSIGILGAKRSRSSTTRRGYRGLGDSSNCSDDDLISCNQSAYDDASSYCDSLSMSGDLTCIQQNMDTSTCACAQVTASSVAPSTDPGASFDPTATISPSTIASATQPKATVTTVVKAGGTSASATQASIFTLKNAAILGVVVVVYSMFFPEKKKS